MLCQRVNKTCFTPWIPFLNLVHSDDHSGHTDSCLFFHLPCLTYLENVSWIPWYCACSTANSIQSNITQNRYCADIQFKAVTRFRHILPSMYLCLSTIFVGWAWGGINWANKQLEVYLQLYILNEQNWVNLHTSKGCHDASLILISHSYSYRAPGAMSKQDTTVGGMEGWGTCLQINNSKC